MCTVTGAACWSECAHTHSDQQAAPVRRRYTNAERRVAQLLNFVRCHMISAGLASCHSSGVLNFEVDPTFLENLCIRVLGCSYFSIVARSECVPHAMHCVAWNILLGISGPRRMGSAVQSEAWESEGSTVRDLATVEGKRLWNNYHYECSNPYRYFLNIACYRWHSWHSIYLCNRCLAFWVNGCNQAGLVIPIPSATAHQTVTIALRRNNRFTRGFRFAHDRTLFLKWKIRSLP
jgi:hypothetical protein